MARVCKPLYVMNGYELHALDRVGAEAFAEVFQEICQRGNPLLQGRPKQELLQLGHLMYQRAVLDPLSTVMTTSGAKEIVAVNVTWDMQGGSLWQGLAVPESLRCHAAVAALCCGSLDSFDRVQFGAFGGVRRGHPGRELMVPGILFGMLGGARMGYNHRFGYMVHPSMLAWMAEEKGNKGSGFAALDRSWELPFSGMEADDDVKAELRALKPDYATCTLTDLRVFRDNFDLISGSLGADVRPLFEGINEGVQLRLRTLGVPFADHFGTSQAPQISAVPVSSKL